MLETIKVSIPSIDNLKEAFERNLNRKAFSFERTGKQKEISLTEFFEATDKFLQDLKHSPSLPPEDIRPGDVIHLDRLQMRELVSAFKQAAIRHTGDHHKSYLFVHIFIDAGFKGERFDLMLPKAA